ncbi:MAG: TolC family protein [bacterium]
MKICNCNPRHIHWVGRASRRPLRWLTRAAASGVAALPYCWLALMLGFAVEPVCAQSNLPPFRVSLSEAVLMALEHNSAFRVQRLQPQIVRTREDTARAAFDPVLLGGISRNRQNGPQFAFQAGSNSTAETARDNTTLQAGVSETLPTGTRLELSGQTDIDHPVYNHTASRIGVSVSQPLLEGAGTEVNLAVLRQTRLDTRISVFELRGFALALVAEVERACWMYVLNRDQLGVYRDSVRVAEQQLEETRERIRVGKLAELEAVAAEAEVASRREGLITSESQFSAARLRLLRLLNLPQSLPWTLIPEISEEPVPPGTALEDVETHVTVALTGRPDLNQARLALERGELEIVRTRNGLLPKMDLFVTLGRSGYASSFDNSVEGQEARGYDVGVGLQVAYPLKNRAASADYRRAVVSRRQVEEALTNLSQLAQEDVRVACVMAEEAMTQVAAAQVTQRLQERKLEAERSKFKEGKSTSMLVAQAERDLLASKLSTIRAVIATLTTRVDLYQKDGSLLARRGLAVPED